MKTKLTANILQEELREACKVANGEFSKYYGYDWDFGVDEVPHNQKVNLPESDDPRDEALFGKTKPKQTRVPSTVLTLSLTTTFPEIPGAHYRDDKVLNGKPIHYGYKKVWQQVIEVKKAGLTEARVFAYRQLISFLLCGFLSGTVFLQPEELETISTNPK